MMRIKTNGNVGINKANPSYKLDVNGTGRFSDNLIAGQAGEEMRIGYTGFSNWAGIMNNSAPQYALMQNGDGKTLINSADGQKIDFRINNANKMTISGSRIGIGTSTPSGQLHVCETAESMNVYFQADSGYGQGENVNLIFRNGAYDMSGITGIDEATATNGTFKGALVFKTTLHNQTDAMKEQMRINNIGNVGIGTPSPTQKLHVAGHITVDAGWSLLVDGTRGIRQPTGNYGSVQTTGSGYGSWEGYSIDGRYVFMSAGDNNVGIYNDVDNQWLWYYNRTNEYQQFYIDGAQKLKLTSNWLHITNAKIDLMGSSYNYNTGISYWSAADTNWATYMATSGASKSYSGGTSCSIGGITSHAIRMRVYSSTDGGFIWENHSEIGLMGLKGNTGDLYVKGGYNLEHNSGSYNLRDNYKIVPVGHTSTWDAYPSIVWTPTSGTSEFRFHGVGGANLALRADGGYLSFTGAHESFREFTENDIGLIVSSTGNYVTDLKDDIYVNGKSINDACPETEISSADKDKKVFGVIGKIVYHAEIEDDNGNKYKKGCYINSIGEGSVWVCNKNGNIENGDYITTSSVAGYGQKQNEEMLCNFTMGKITQDCDFNPPMVMKKKVRRGDKGQLLYSPITGKVIADACMDENNNPIMESLYPVRYLKDDSTQITKAEYDSLIANGELAYIAAMVGCTYHCG